RRHTSSYGDWSSDVCSSDLHVNPTHLVLAPRADLEELVIDDWQRIEQWGPAEVEVVSITKLYVERAFPDKIQRQDVRLEPVAQRSEERRVGKECRWLRSQQQ